MRVCYVAGHEMVAIQKSDEQPHLYQLEYLNFTSDDYAGMDAAISDAPLFAIEVLKKTIDMVGDTGADCGRGGPDVPTPAGPLGGADHDQP